jgi:hypothetical protein
MVKRLMNLLTINEAAGHSLSYAVKNSKISVISKDVQGNGIVLKD